MSRTYCDQIEQGSLLTGVTRVVGSAGREAQQSCEETAEEEMRQ